MLAIIKMDSPDTANFAGTALLYLNRQTYEEIKREYPRADGIPQVGQIIGQMFGIAIMLYHGIPIGRWELVQRESGENITSGWLWEDVEVINVQLPKIGTCEINPEPHEQSHYCNHWEALPE